MLYSHKGGELAIEYLTQNIHLKHLTPAEIECLDKLSKLLRQHYNYLIWCLDLYYKAEGKLMPLGMLLQAETNSKYYLGGGFYLARQARTNFYTSFLKNNKPIKQTNKPMSITFKPKIQGNRITMQATKYSPPITFEADLICDCKDIKTVTISIRSRKMGYWKAAITYEQTSTENPPICSYDGLVCAGLDFGIENFATICTSNGKSLIVDGRRLKSIVHCYIKNGKSAAASIRYNNRTFDYINKSVSVIVGFCIKNDVKAVVLGEGVINGAFRVQQQNKFLNLFCFSQFQKNLIQKLKMNGIATYLVNEAYTSAASFLDNDCMPMYTTRTKPNFSGKRTCRGLYVSSNGTKINADINGSLNILRKSRIVDLTELQRNPSLIEHPKRVDPLNQ